MLIHLLNKLNRFIVGAKCVLGQHVQLSHAISHIIIATTCPLCRIIDFIHQVRSGLRSVINQVESGSNTSQSVSRLCCRRGYLFQGHAHHTDTSHSSSCLYAFRYLARHGLNLRFDFVDFRASLATIGANLYPNFGLCHCLNFTPCLSKFTNKVRLCLLAFSSSWRID